MIFFVEAYWLVGILSVVIYLIIHYIEIVPRLKAHKVLKISSWLTNIRQDEDLEKYKELCLEDKKTLFWYRLLNMINNFTLSYIFGWFICLILLAIFD